MAPSVVWDTPKVELDLMAEARQRANGKSFSRPLLPHEQEAKAQGRALAERLKQRR